MFSEDDLLPISALQHLLFCERQCALIHIEQVWEENRLTAEGRVLHERVHERENETRRDVRIARALRLRSLALGLIGQADVVEFHQDLKSEISNLKSDPKVPQAPRPFPVEYKRGRPKSNRCDEVQLCAQALCLEEMLGTEVTAGALFYGVTHRRHDVAFDGELRALTSRTAERLHVLIESGVTPPAEYSAKCEQCSLKDSCLPATITPRRSAVDYLRRVIDLKSQI